MELQLKTSTSTFLSHALEIPGWFSSHLACFQPMAAELTIRNCYKACKRLPLHVLTERGIHLNVATFGDSQVQLRVYSMSELVSAHHSLGVGVRTPEGSIFCTSKFLGDCDCCWIQRHLSTLSLNVLASCIANHTKVWRWHVRAQ